MSKFSTFYNNVKDQGVEVSSKVASFQCMDLAYLWAFCLDVPKVAIQHPSAYMVFKNPNSVTKEYFDIIKNTPDFVPKTGDIGVFDKGYHIGKDGHIVVCTGEGDIKTFKSLDQNWNGVKYSKIVTHDYRLFLGVLRRKGFKN